MNSDVEKYVRMLRVGVPERGVRDCMAHDGVAAERMDEHLARAQRIRRGYLMARDAEHAIPAPLKEETAVAASRNAVAQDSASTTQMMQSHAAPTGASTASRKEGGIAGAIARWTRSLRSRLGGK